LLTVPIATTLGRQQDAGRALVGRRHDDRLGRRRRQRVDVEAAPVDGDRDGDEPGSSGDPVVLGRARVLQRHMGDAGGGEGRQHHVEGLAKERS
jgi:hypothetical protein